jgi:hypothetical protein
MPYHFDPGKIIVYARAAVQWFPMIPQYNQYYNLGEYFECQVLFPYIVAFLYKISGISLVVITKWVVIISGAALSLTVYYLSFEIFNNRTSALISAFLIAVSKVQLIGYMNYYPQIMAMTIMPVAFVFLIRYFKYEKFKYLILTAALSSLIVLTSYLTALVYFLILFLSISIYGIWKKKSLKILIFLPLMTGALIAFFWLPIVWRHGLIRILDTANGLILNTPDAFTNQPWSLMNFVTFSNTTVIGIIMGIISLIFVRKVKWDFQRLLLAVWLIVALVLMESYLVKPFLWVDRYYPFFDIALIIIVGIFMVVLIEKLNNIKQIRYNFKGYFLLLLLIYPLYGALNVDYIFGRWGYPSDFQTLENMQYLPAGSLVAAPQGINGFWVPAISGVNILGGFTSQLIDPGYSGDADSDLIINSPDVNIKMEMIRKYGVNYIYIPIHKNVNMVWNPSLNMEGIGAFNNDSYFEVKNIYKDTYGITAIVKVKEYIKPKYNIEKIDWTVTLAGYLISVFSLMAFAYLYKSREKI